eukprot:TRINITY_DN538_c0_g2_i1.p1 TRINITY_DN538_c0_g2~~TRINITY_DN538_c0_g2_i1.p1  ORF type:complete len:231 (-),score=30.24 TRINITY_DN538_c0_g2_i1:280-972(-)
MENILYQLISSSGLFFMLSSNDIRNLTLTSTSISKILREHISTYWWFKFRKEFRSFVYYSPKRILINFNCKDFSTPEFLKQVTHVTLGNMFSVPITSPLPPNTTHLRFSYYYKQPITSLPHKLISLSFGYSYDSPLDNVTFPSTLKQLTLGDLYTHPLTNLPLGLTHVSRGMAYDHPLTILPCSITHLKVGLAFSHPIDTHLSSLQQLTLSIHYQLPIDHLDKTVQIIRV